MIIKQSELVKICRVASALSGPHGSLSIESDGRTTRFRAGFRQGYFIKSTESADFTGGASVEIKALTNMIRPLNGDLDFTLIDQAIQIRFMSGLELRGTTSDDFIPDVDMRVDDIGIEIPASSIYMMIKQLLPTVYECDDRPGIAQIHISNGTGYATDGCELATAPVQCNSTFDIPRDLAKALAIIARDLWNTPMLVSIGAHEISISVDGWSLFAKIDEDFPDVSQIVETKPSARAAVSTADLLSGIKMCEAIDRVVSAEYNSVLESVYLRVENAAGEHGYVRLHASVDVAPRTLGAATLSAERLRKALDCKSRHTILEFFGKGKEVRVISGSKNSTIAQSKK